jgi:hypothetical protein
MPTGYTAILTESKRKVTFEEFALRCSRAFGALVQFRDNSLEMELPSKIEPDPYHANQLIKAKKELNQFLKLSQSEIKDQADKSHKQEMDYYQERLETFYIEYKIYSDMLAKVKAWTPPTEDHSGIKEFMIDQLTNSLPYPVGHFPVKPTTKEWYDIRLKSLNHSIEYHKNHMEKENNSCSSNTEWLNALRQSVKGME